MNSSQPQAIAPENRSTQAITEKLERFLRRSQVRHVHFAEASIAPPTLAYVTHFPRLYLPLWGSHVMEVAQNGIAKTIRPRRGDAVFVRENAWDKPEWSSGIEVLTFLFGSRHIGISLAQHHGGRDTPVTAIKTNIHGATDALTQTILQAITVYSSESTSGPLACLLTESLLHSCLNLLKKPTKAHSGKAVRTYESICLYVQENFQSCLTRQNVAKHFGLAPSHISRLFRQEGQVQFHDYLNTVRMNRAKFMLRNYSIPLKEIAANCGYGDIAYFCRIFKQMNRETPTQYRATEDGSTEAHKLQAAAS